MLTTYRAEELEGAWRAFKANVIVHDPLKWAIAPRLCQKQRVFALHQHIPRDVHAEQPVNPVNAMPCHRVVSPDQPTRENRPSCSRVVDPNLQHETQEFIILRKKES